MKENKFFKLFKDLKIKDRNLSELLNMSLIIEDEIKIRQLEDKSESFKNSNNQ